MRRSTAIFGSVCRLLLCSTALPGVLLGFTGCLDWGSENQGGGSGRPARPGLGHPVQDIELISERGRFLLRSESLAHELEFTLEDRTEDPGLEAGSRIISEGVILTASAVEVVSLEKPALVSLVIPEAARQGGVQVLMRESGDQISVHDAHVAGDWHPVPARLSEDRSALQVEIMAFAEAQEFLLVKTGEAFKSGKKPLAPRLGAGRIQGVMKAGGTIAAERSTKTPWAVVCDTTLEGRMTQLECESLGFKTAVDRFLTHLSEASLRIRYLNFPELDRIAVALSNEDTLSSGGSPYYLSQAADGADEFARGTVYATVYVRRRLSCPDAAGCFHPGTGAIEIQVGSVYGGNGSVPPAEVAAHEVFHAVQMGEIPFHFAQYQSLGAGQPGQWFIEGTAAAIGVHHRIGGNPEILDQTHFQGVARDFRTQLNSTSGLDAYTSMEHLVSLGMKGDITWVAPALHAMGASSPRSDPISDVSKAVLDIGLSKDVVQPLGRAFANSLKRKGSPLATGSCETRKVMGKDTPFLGVTSSTEGDTLPLSQRCFEVQSEMPEVKATLDNPDPGGCLVVELDETSKQRQVLMLDGKIIEAGAEELVQGNIARIQVVDIDEARAPSVAAPWALTVTVLSEGEKSADGKVCTSPEANDPCGLADGQESNVLPVVYCGPDGCSVYAGDGGCTARMFRCGPGGCDHDLGGCSGLVTAMINESARLAAISTPVNPATSEFPLPGNLLGPDKQCGEVSFCSRYIVLCGK